MVRWVGIPEKPTKNYTVQKEMMGLRYSVLRLVGDLSSV